MKIYKYILAVAVLAGMSAGCKKTLQESPYSFYSPNNLYKTQADAESAITGLYGILTGWSFFKAPYLFSEDADHDHIVGPVWNFSSQGAGAYDQYWGVGSMWQGLYNISAQVNTILEKVPGITFTADSIKNRVMGEAYFFRGWSYFNLVRLWGAVPMRLTNVTTTSADKAKSSVAEIYNQVISDLSQAENLLPGKKSVFAGPAGTVTRGAAKALLAKVYLTMASGAATGSVKVQGGTDNAYYVFAKEVVAGYEGMDSKTLFAKARDKAQEVISSGDYSLQAHYMDIWGRANKNNPEMIWEYQSQDNGNYGTYLQYWYSSPWYGGTSYMWMARNLYDSYQQQDERALNGVFHQYFMYGAWMLYPERDSALYKNAPGGNLAKFYSSYSHPFTKKYWIGTSDEIGDAATSTNGGLRDVNFPMLRYADVLLVYAEAASEANEGPTTEAYTALNQVRHRSNEQDTTGLNKEDFRSLVLEERGKELYQENNRRFDLIRWGIFTQVMNQVGAMENVIKTRSKKNLLFPIPQSEINANKLIGENNFGW
ncbi:MAG: RagB/SusD family nutrient uptake outer membrane protein [Chitinophagaceae bacterium]|nr:RagB/SusD family nutrient uptake outer membrane protein [Chitinophagaceae bacterium]